MTTTSVSSSRGGLDCVQVALVTYLPDPLGSFLTQVRHSLGGKNIPEAHITVLPPRPLVLSVEDASDEIRRLLLNVATFEVELGIVKLFPTTKILYIDMVSGRRELLNLHGSLNIGPLYAEERFEFIPHLTLTGPLVPDSIAPTVGLVDNAWNKCSLSRHFLVNELVMLCQSDGDEWTRVSSFRLKRHIGAATQT